MKRKKKPETDSELLERYRAIEKFEVDKGRIFDLRHELCTAIARRENDLAEKKAKRQMIWGRTVHYAIQVGLAYYIYTRWNDLDVKLLLLWLLIFFYRFVAHSVDKILYVQARTVLWLAMANPKAKEDFFRSEHCYTWDGIGSRVYDLIRKQPS
jgi:hypothetical protein